MNKKLLLDLITILILINVCFANIHKETHSFVTNCKNSGILCYLNITKTIFQQHCGGGDVGDGGGCGDGVGDSGGGGFRGSGGSCGKINRGDCGCGGGDGVNHEHGYKHTRAFIRSCTAIPDRVPYSASYVSTMQAVRNEINWIHFEFTSSLPVQYCRVPYSTVQYRTALYSLQ